MRAQRFLSLYLTLTSLQAFAAETAPSIFGDYSACVGGTTATFSLDKKYPNSTYQWYKDGKAVSGATSYSYTHITGNMPDVKHDFYCEITTEEGEKIKSNNWSFIDKTCCTDDTGLPVDEKLIWQDDFGTFTEKGKYWVWDYTDINNPEKVQKTTADGWTYELDYTILGAEYRSVVMEEGTYSVSANVTSKLDEANTGTMWDWQAQTFYGFTPKNYGKQFAPDHTYGGSAYGAMLFLNCGNEPDEVIYSRTISGLCDRTITAKCYISNFSASITPVKIKIRLTDLNSGTSYTSKTVVREVMYDKQASYDPQTAWNEVSISIDLTGNSPEVLLEIISEGGGDEYNTNGNDLLLDDIQIWACSAPNVNLTFDRNDMTKDIVTCDGSDISLDVDETPMIKNYYRGDARYLYQYSLDPSDIKSWKSIGSATKETSCNNIGEILESTKSGDNVYFRVVLGSEETLNALGSDYAYNPNDVCAAYSVSNAISMTIDCPTCTEPNSDIKIIADRPMEKDNVISLCYGESVTLSQAEDITPNEEDWEESDFAGFAIKWFENGNKGSMRDAQTVLNGKISDKVITFDDHSLEGTSMKVVLYAVDALYLEGSCYTADTVYIKFNEAPKAEFITAEATFCDGAGKGMVDLTLKNGNASDYKIKWWYGTDTSTAVKLVDNEPASFFEDRTPDESGTYLYQLIDKEAPYCRGDVHEFNLTVNEVPEAPKDEYIQYTVSGRIEELGTENFSQNVTTDPSLLWYYSDDRATDFDVMGKTSVTIDRTTATSYLSQITYYIAYFNGYCYSERAKVEVEVLAAPKPAVKDLDLCQGGTFDPMEGIRVDTGYDLIWFADPTDTVGNALTTPPTNFVDIETPGQYSYYVAQRSTTEPYAQSDVAEFKVTVYGVKEPRDLSKHEYCATEAAEPLRVEIIQDMPNFYYADKVVYVVGTFESNESFVPNTDVFANMRYEYQAYQTFSAPISGNVCVGPQIKIGVDVTYVPEPSGILTVNYSQAEDAAGFDPIPVQNPQVIDLMTDPGYTLLWGKEATALSWCKSTDSDCEACKPTYDPMLEDGKTQIQYRYAKWRQEIVSGKFCESVPAEVTITISSQSGTEDIISNDVDAIVNVYTISGALVKSNVKRSEALEGLANGTYLVGNQKVVVNK